MSATIFSESWVCALCKNISGHLICPHSESSCHCSDVEAEKQDGKGEKQRDTKGILAICRAAVDHGKGGCRLTFSSLQHPSLQLLCSKV